MFKQLLFVIAFLILGQYVYSQCCSAGNPIDSDGDNKGISKRQLLIQGLYKHSYSNQYYQGTQAVEILSPGAIERSYYNYTSLKLTYGISNKLSAMGDIGYYINRTEAYQSLSDKKGFGLGDCSLALKYNLYQNEKRRIEFIPFAGVRLPVGVFDQEVDGIKNPITLQPSSGSIKYLFNLFAYKGFTQRFSTYYLATVELSQLIDSRNFYLKYGNLYAMSVFCAFKHSKVFSTILQARIEHKEQSKREQDQIMIASGYTILFIAPKIGYNFSDNWFAGIGVDIPVLKRMNSFQLTNAYSASVRIVRKLDL